MAASKAQMNWTGVAHGPTAITRVTTMMFGQGGALVSHMGDGDQYPSIMASAKIEPHASVTSADVGTLFGILSGTIGTLTGTLADALKASGGAVVFAMANAVLENVNATGAHGTIANAVATFKAFATDGVTNPTSLSRV
jgi:hypothetical protein